MLCKTAIGPKLINILDSSLKQQFAAAGKYSFIHIGLRPLNKHKEAQQTVVAHTVSNGLILKYKNVKLLVI